MNRKQKKLKIQNATMHKIKCNWLNGGNPRKLRLSRNSLWYKMRWSRKKRIEISNRTMKAYINKYRSLDIVEV